MQPGVPCGPRDHIADLFHVSMSFGPMGQSYIGTSQHNLDEYMGLREPLGELTADQKCFMDINMTVDLICVSFGGIGTALGRDPPHHGVGVTQSWISHILTFIKWVTL